MLLIDLWDDWLDATHGNCFRKSMQAMGNEADKLTKRHKEDPVALAIGAHEKNTGKWLWTINKTLSEGLAAIALACSTPDDNSEEIKRLTAILKQSTDALESAVKDNQPKIQ